MADPNAGKSGNFGGDEPHIIDPSLVWSSEEGAVQLRATRCEDCSHETFPPADLCPGCLSDKMKPFPVEGEGTLYSYSVVHTAPAQWNSPYALGYVDFPGGLRVLGHIQAPLDEIKIGTKLDLSLGTVGTAEDGAPAMTYVFVPRKDHA